MFFHGIVTVLFNKRFNLGLVQIRQPNDSEVFVSSWQQLFVGERRKKVSFFWRIYKTSAPKAQRWKLNCHVIITQPNYGFQMGAAGRLRT